MAGTGQKPNPRRGPGPAIGALVIALVFCCGPLSFVGYYAFRGSRVCEDSNSIVVRAATGGDTAAIDRADEPTISEQDRFEMTPILCAAQFDQLGSTQSLVRRHADLHARSPRGETALTIASNHANVDIVSTLLDGGALRPDSPERRRAIASALGGAASDDGDPFAPSSPFSASVPFSPPAPNTRDRRLAILQLLLDHGATPADTARAAIGFNDVAALRFALDHGADLDGATAELFAKLARSGRIAEVLPLLLDRGVSPQRVYEKLLDADDVDSLRLVLDRGVTPTSDDLQHLMATPLWLTLQAQPPPNGNAMVRALVEHSASPRWTGVGPSPLLMATYTGQADLVDLFLAGGANPDDGGLLSAFFIKAAIDRAAGHDTSDPADAAHFPVPLESPVNVPPLVAAAAFGDAATVRRLLVAGADPNGSMGGVWQPVFGAALRGDEEAINALLEAGANPSPPTWPGIDSPAEAARRRGHESAARTLEAAKGR